MKKIILVLILFSLVFGNAFSQENELHAFELEHQGIYPVKNFLDNPLFVDYNISFESTPQNEPTLLLLHGGIFAWAGKNRMSYAG
jgi:hypothetical protein